MGLTMRIDGLNEEQIMICDLLYACQSVEEYRHLMSMFDERQRLIASTLSQLMIHEHIEETWMAECEHYQRYPDAEEIINYVRNKYDT